MNDVINRANLPSVLNGVTMSECDKVIEPFLEERSCDEVWHAVRALRDFYDWVMSENTIEPCKDDLIKRSDAIKAYNEAMDELVKEEMEEWGLVDFTECSFNTTDCKLIARKIESIPAVEPSEYADIAYGIGVCQGKASVEPCEDAVSREWLLDELEQMNVANFYELNIHSNEMYKQMKRMLRDAPSVTVEPKHGKWKINNNGWTYCPECESLGLESYNFCPYCGTKLTDKNIFDKGIDVPNKTYESKWIPCKEKLPEAEKKVWIQTDRGKVCFAMYEDGTISENDSDWHWYDLNFENWDEENDCGIIPEGWWEWTEFHPDCEFDCPVDEKVVAWQPLPEPWKGADDDSNSE